MGEPLDLMVVDDEPLTRFMFNALAEHQGLVCREFDHQQALIYIKEEKRPLHIIVDLKDIPGASLIEGGYDRCFESTRKIHSYLRALVEFRDQDARQYRDLAERGGIPKVKFRNILSGFRFMTSGISQSDVNFVNGLYHPEREILIKVHGSDRGGRPNTCVSEYIIQIAKNLGKFEERYARNKP
mgnify:CR=1 FL=1|jgi:hypothetical protein